jgi:integrase
MPQRERHAADTEQCGACGPFTPSGFAKLLARAGDEAKIGFKLHPHMLRHACGYALANKPERFRPILAIAPSTRPRAMPSWLRVGSKTFGVRRSQTRPNEARAERRQRNFAEGC